MTYRERVRTPDPEAPIKLMQRSPAVASATAVDLVALTFVIAIMALAASYFGWL